MSDQIKQTSQEWYKRWLAGGGPTILFANGWDDVTLFEYWNNVEIDEQEFNRRMASSTLYA